MVYAGGLYQSGRISNIRSRYADLCNVNSSECKIKVLTSFSESRGPGTGFGNGSSQGSKNKA